MIFSVHIIRDIYQRKYIKTLFLITNFYFLNDNRKKIIPVIKSYCENRLNYFLHETRSNDSEFYIPSCPLYIFVHKTWSISKTEEKSEIKFKMKNVISLSLTSHVFTFFYNLWLFKFIHKKCSFVIAPQHYSNLTPFNINQLWLIEVPPGLEYWYLILFNVEFKYVMSIWFNII